MVRHTSAPWSEGERRSAEALRISMIEIVLNLTVEANALLNGQKDRLDIAGDAPMLAPEAFSTMTLVVHELVANSAKNGALLIKWREGVGPLVQVPKRRGFGSTIIERAIPFELKGKVETRFTLGGSRPI